MRIAEVFNEYLANITNRLDLAKSEANPSFSENIEDTINKAVQKYKSHPSIKVSSINRHLNIYWNSEKLKPKMFLSSLKD